jgi:serine/threonine protein kinase
MELTPGALIEGRYELVDRLGDGAMGQVWRARDTRFESRTVAVKFLREDQTLIDDAERRARLVARLNALSSSRALDAEVVVDALASALGGRDLTTLRARVEARLAGSPPTRELVATMFDEFANDPALNENARLRVKLRRLFRDEANSVANLRHDHIVSIFDYGEVEGTPYLVMDYIEGRTLHHILEQRLTLALSTKLQLIEDLCAGLAFAHSRRLVHRDIKPANLIIDHTTGRLKILDFGVVRRLGSDSTVGIPIGTLCYMSPEQTQGAANLDHRSDIFAVGVVFYELITGNKAFPAGKSVGDLVVRIQREAPPPISGVVPNIPARVQQIIDKAIAKRPEDRYQDLREMEREIARVRTELESADRVQPTVVMKAPDLGATILAKPSASAAQMRPPLKVPVFVPPAAAKPAPPPTPTPAPAPAPAPAPQQGAPTKAWPIGAVVAAIVILGVASVLLWTQLPTSAPEIATTPSASAASDVSGPAEAASGREGGSDAPSAPSEPGAAAAPGPLSAPELNSVTIDVRPWARVRVVATKVPEGQSPPQVPTEPLYAPFTIDLAPGDYTLEAENGGLNRNATFQIKVEGSKPQSFVRTMPGFNATKIVDALLAQQD